MKIDVVYKLGIGSKHNDCELRYSLRSLSNFKDLGQVWVIGYKPEWCTNVNYVKCGDFLESNKDGNLIRKLILACQQESLSDQFLNFSDDQLLLRECNYIDFAVPIYDNSLIQFKQDQRLSKWKTRLKNTIFTLQEKNLPSNCYEAHIPTLINKHDFEKTVSQYNYAYGQGMCGNTLYYNTLRKEGIELPSDFSLKIEDEIKEIERIEALFQGQLHLNYSEDAANEVFLSFLDKKFPQKSKYELY